MSLGRGSTGTRRSPPSSSSSPEAIDPGTKALQHTLALIPIGIPIRNERVRRFRCILGRWLLAEAEALSCLVVAATGFDLRIRQVLARKSVVEGKSVSVRVDLGGRRLIKKKKHTT